MSLKNQSQFIGRIGNEFELKHFEGGNCVTNVSLAIDESYKDREGNKVDKTTWVSLVVRNKLADIFEKYLNKGDKITVQCFYAPRSWDKDDGTKGYAHEFQVVAVELPERNSQ